MIIYRFLFKPRWAAPNLGQEQEELIAEKAHHFGLSATAWSLAPFQWRAMVYFVAISALCFGTAMALETQRPLNVLGGGIQKVAGIFFIWGTVQAVGIVWTGIRDFGAAFNWIEEISRKHRPT